MINPYDKMFKSFEVMSELYKNKTVKISNDEKIKNAVFEQIMLQEYKNFLI